MEALQTLAIEGVKKFIKLSGLEESYLLGDEWTEDPAFLNTPGRLISVVFQLENIYQDGETAKMRAEVRWGNLARGMYWDVVFAEGDAIELAFHTEVAASSDGLCGLECSGCLFDLEDLEGIFEDEQPLELRFTGDEGELLKWEHDIFPESLRIIKAAKMENA